MIYPELINPVNSIKAKDIFFSSDGYLSFWDWERETLKAFVVEKEVMQELKNKSKTDKGFDSEKMTKLYGEYLRS